MVNQKKITKDNLYESIKKAQAYGTKDSWYRIIYVHLTKMRQSHDHNNYIAMIEHFIHKEEYIDELIEILEKNGEI